jgi:hypothetical protein
MSEQCPVPGCEVDRGHKPMCRPHWLQVPRGVRDALWQALGVFEQTPNEATAADLVEARDAALASLGYTPLV